MLQEEPSYPRQHIAVAPGEPDPRALDALLYTGDAEARSRVMSAMLGMHKFDLAALEARLAALEASP